MPIVHFFGEVWAPGFEIYCDDLPKFKEIDRLNNIESEFLVEIEKSKIHVTVETSSYSQDNFVHLYMRAFDSARTAAELIAFKKGLGISITLSKFIRPDGIKSDISFRDPKLESLCTSFYPGVEIYDVFKMVAGNHAIASILNDLIASITIPHVSTVNCARAVEGIRHLVARGASNRNQEWSQMRDALNLDENYLKLITDHSKDSRHGKGIYIPGNITTEITRRSWVIMNRFIEFKKRGGKHLPKKEFPMLKS